VTSPRLRRLPLVADVGDNDSAVAELELGAVVLSDLQALLEAERLAEPFDGLADVGVREDGNNSGGWNRAVGLHLLNSIHVAAMSFGGLISQLASIETEPEV
jgi:hypothetical protein